MKNLRLDWSEGDWIISEATKAVPSPWGEGQGEGGRETHFASRDEQRWRATAVQDVGAFTGTSGGRVPANRNAVAAFSPALERSDYAG